MSNTNLPIPPEGAPQPEQPSVDYNYQTPAESATSTAPDMDAGMSPGQPPKKKKTALIVIGVIVGILLLCCCIPAIASIAFLGSDSGQNMIMDTMLEMENDMYGELEDNEDLQELLNSDMFQDELNDDDVENQGIIPDDTQDQQDKSESEAPATDAESLDDATFDAYNTYSDDLYNLVMDQERRRIEASAVIYQSGDIEAVKQEIAQFEPRYTKELNEVIQKIGQMTVPEGLPSDLKESLEEAQSKFIEGYELEIKRIEAAANGDFKMEAAYVEESLDKIEEGAAAMDEADAVIFGIDSDEPLF